MRKSAPRLWNGVTSSNYYGPAPFLPYEYCARLANRKPVKLSNPTDPKFTWKTFETEVGSIHPAFFGKGKGTPSVINDHQGGPGGDMPPIPVYRKSILCMGHYSPMYNHPRMFIKTLPGKIAYCKWCRLKFINMSGEGDCDDNWEEEQHAIAVSPETMADIKKPRRDVLGQILPSNFANGAEPDPDVHKSVYNPEKYRWRQVDETGKLMPPKREASQ